METGKGETALSKSRALELFLHSEKCAVTFGDLAKQRQSVDLERLFFGQEGQEEEGDDQEVGEVKGEADRKDSDTSSGFADQPPEHQQTPWSRGDGSTPDPRRVGVAWERANNLYARIQEIKDKEEEDEATSSGKRSRKEKDKARVKTALRRLLNERLFGANNEKVKTNKEHGNSIVLTPVGVGSFAGTRSGTTHKVRPVAQGKVAFAEDEASSRNSRRQNGASRANSRSRAEYGSETTSEDSTLSQDRGSSQIRLPTRSGSRLPPLRTPSRLMSRVFTPAHHPKWDIYITASQRAALTEGLQRDRTFLSQMSRQRGRTACASPSLEDGLYPYRNGRSAEDDATDDETQCDPHRPDKGGLSGAESGSQGTWAERTPDGRQWQAEGRVAYTNSSGKLRPIDLDEWRLRRLLQELYRDKKFMDNLIHELDAEHLDFPDTMAAEDVKFLSEFGRDYLLQRALYWEEHGPLGPPRPPPSALGMRLQRAQTTMTSQNIHSDEQEVTSPRPKTVR